MKNLYKSLVMIAATAITFAGCTQKEVLDTPKDGELVTLKFNIRNADENTVTATKALLGSENGKNFLDWEDGDKIGTFSVGTFGTSSTTSNNNAGTVEVSGSDYTLNVQAFSAGSITDIYSYYPYSASAGKDKTAAIVTIPESQFINAAGFDADAMPMAGTPVTVDLTVVANTDTPCGTINFSNLGSIINFKIYSSTATEETLTSVKYVTSGDVAGTFSIDLTGIDASNESSLALSAYNAVSEITTTYTTHPAIPQGKANALDVFMVVAPGAYANTQVIVTTSEHTYTLTASGEKTYTRSHVKPMNVDIQNGTPGDLPVDETWSKVTSASEFTAGTYYILRADGSYYVPNATGNPSCVAFSSEGGITNAMKWTATASGNGLVFESVANPGNYLWTTNTGSANTISVTESSTGANASKVWSFALITVNNATYYTATAGASKYLVSYGTSNWRYYATSNINASNIPAEFYKLDVVDNTPRFTVDSPLEATAGEDTYTINVTRSNFTGAIAVTIPAECDWVATDDVAVNATSFDVLVAENTGAARSVTLTLSAAGVDSQELVINQAGIEPGTESNPYTVSEAIAAANALDSGATTDIDVYITGIVSTVSSFNSTYHSITYYISADGTKTSELEVYSGKGIDGANFSNIYDLAIGDQVIIKGKLQNYNGTSEIYMNNQLVSITQVTRYTISLGSVTNGTIEASTTSAGAQAEITLTANPASGYKLESWTVTKATSGDAVSVANGIFTMPADNVNVTATFAEDNSTLVTDELTNSNTIGETTTTYKEWTVANTTTTSGAAYSGQSAGGEGTIQLRSNNNNSGIVSTTSGGKVRKVKVTWNSSTNSARTITIYGKNSAYSSPSDLYDTSKQGTSLGTIAKSNGTELTITDDYDYIGIRSTSGALYIDKVEISWEN